MMWVVNCLQKKIPLKDWHLFIFRNVVFYSCELLTKKNTFEGLTPARLSLNLPLQLWIAYKKKYLWRIDTLGLVEQTQIHVVNCLQKKIPLKDWHLESSGFDRNNSCELLTKKNTFEGLTPLLYILLVSPMLWIAYKKKYLWRIDTLNTHLSKLQRVVNCLQKKIPLKDWHPSGIK